MALSIFSHKEEDQDEDDLLAVDFFNEDRGLWKVFCFFILEMFHLILKFDLDIASFRYLLKLFKLKNENLKITNL